MQRFPYFSSPYVDIRAQNKFLYNTWVNCVNHFHYVLLLHVNISELRLSIFLMCRLYISSPSSYYASSSTSSSSVLDIFFMQTMPITYGNEEMCNTFWNCISADTYTDQERVLRSKNTVLANLIPL